MSNPGREPGRHLVLVGPTASGKSATALVLAMERSAAGMATEIVSCDSMAVYRGMDIGTATPTAEEQELVAHHLIDVADPAEEFSVRRFVDLVDGALDDIEERGASAILVGGTGLYVQAVVDRLDLPGRYPEVLVDLEPLGTDELARRLGELDPVAATRVPPGNRRRLLRALEVTIGSGRPFSASGPGLAAHPPTPFPMVGLAVDREVLTRRIRTRYERQMAAGFIEEVRALPERSEGWSRTAREALGYRELAAHLRGELDLAEAVEEAVHRTRRFAVRQERWFRRDPRIQWIDAPNAGSQSVSAAGIAEVAHAVARRWSELADGGRGDATTVDPSCYD